MMNHSKSLLLSTTLFLYVYSSFLSSEPLVNQEKEQHEDTLADIEKYRNIDPKHAHNLLISHAEEVNSLNLDSQKRWWVAAIRVGFLQNDNRLVEGALDELVKLKKHEDDALSVNQMLLYTGHLGMRISSYDIAKQAYACMYLVEKVQKSEFHALYTLGYAYFSEKKFDMARTIFIKLARLADLTDRQYWKPIMYNALGSLDMETESYESAAKHYQRALDLQYQAADRNSEVVAGLSLLSAFTMADNTKSYDRLYMRIERLTRRHKNQNLETLLDWIESVNRFKRGNDISDIQKDLLIDKFNQIDNDLVRQTIRNLLAPLLSVDVGESISESESNALQGKAWVTTLLNHHNCPRSDEVDGIAKQQISDVQRKIDKIPSN